MAISNKKQKIIEKDGLASIPVKKGNFGCHNCRKYVFEKRVFEDEFGQGFDECVICGGSL